MAIVLSNEEKETLISFDETPSEAVIFTYNKRWQKQLEKRLGLKPTMNNGYGGREYHIPKQRIPLPRAPKKLTAEQRKKLADNLRVRRRQKSSNQRQNKVVTSKSRAGLSFEGKTIAPPKEKKKKP